MTLVTSCAGKVLANNKPTKGVKCLWDGKGCTALSYFYFRIVKRLNFFCYSVDVFEARVLKLLKPTVNIWVHFCFESYRFHFSYFLSKSSTCLFLSILKHFHASLKDSWRRQLEENLKGCYISIKVFIISNLYYWQIELKFE